MNKKFTRDLLNCLNNMQRRPKRSKKANGGQARPRARPRRRKPRRTGPTPGTTGVAQVTPLARGLAAGDVVVSRSELLTTVSTSVATAILHPSNFPWLANLAKVFERYRFVTLQLEYRPLVGTTTAGSVAMGVDWTTSSMALVSSPTGQLYLKGYKAADRTDILALTPSADTPVWQRIPRIAVPSGLLQSRLWYDTSTPGSGAVIPDYAPGYVASVSSADKAGEVWVHYKVHLSGTRKA